MRELKGDWRDLFNGFMVALDLRKCCLALLGIFVTITHCGGAIARIAAYEIAKDGERIETRKALQFAKRKFWSFFWAPLICVIGFFFFWICNYAGGLIGGVLDFIKIGAPLVALLLPLALLSGFIMTLICVGTVT